MMELMLAKMDSFQERLIPGYNQENETMACQEATKTCLEKTEARTETDQEPREVGIKPNLEDVKATELEANQEEIGAMAAEHQEVHNEEATVELSEHWRTDMGTGI
jgi:uncharacterized protein (DUF362 family)